MPKCDFKVSRTVESAGGIAIFARLYEGDDAGGTYERTAILAEQVLTAKVGASKEKIDDTVAAWAGKLTAHEPVAAQKPIFERTK